MTGWWSSSTDGIVVPADGVALGRIEPPPSKSLTHRALAIALLARRPTEILDPLLADDTRLFLAALETLGYRVAIGERRLTVEPAAPLPEEATIECGNAGTFFRFVVALAATLPGRTRIDGSPRLRERPVAPLLSALRGLGVTVECLEREGFAPLRVHGAGLRGGRVRLDARESSQYLSALLLAAQGAAGPVEVEVHDLVSAPYVDLTAELLQKCGGFVERVGADLWCAEPRPLDPGTIAIEPDLSAAAYPAAAVALTTGDVLLERVSLASLQGDRRLLLLLEEMGARVSEEQGGVRVFGDELRALDVDASDIPDQVPTLAAIAPFARGTTRIRNVAHLRIKESDRLAAMASELRRVGAEVEEQTAGLVIHGDWARVAPPAVPVTVDPHDDHRIAMAMALVGLRRPGVTIRDPRVVAKSWPGFWEAMASLMRRPAPEAG